jgi:hypothetical protein
MNCGSKRALRDLEIYKGAVQTVRISDETKLKAFFALTLDQSVPN